MEVTDDEKDVVNDVLNILEVEPNPLRFALSEPASLRLGSFGSSSDSEHRKQLNVLVASEKVKK